MTLMSIILFFEETYEYNLKIKQSRLHIKLD